MSSCPESVSHGRSVPSILADPTARDISGRELGGAVRSGSGALMRVLSFFRLSCPNSVWRTKGQSDTQSFVFIRDVKELGPEQGPHGRLLDDRQSARKATVPESPPWDLCRVCAFQNKQRPFQAADND